MPVTIRKTIYSVLLKKVKVKGYVQMNIFYDFPFARRNSIRTSTSVDGGNSANVASHSFCVKSITVLVISHRNK